MGTNYYVILNECQGCKRYDSLHVGKNSYGWPFTFRAYVDLDLYSYPGLEEEIKSKQDWEAFLKKPGMRIVNEYDEEISYQALIELAESKLRTGDQSLHFNDFLDEEGYTFTTEEFS
jgi:hypothetical protein